MDITQKQYQIELERELVHKLNQLQSLEINAPEVNLDPLAQLRKQQLNLEVERIRQAQTRLNKGQFGVCQVCHQPIHPERLQIVPYAELCTGCQKKADDKRRLQHRIYPVPARVAY